MPRAAYRVRNGRAVQYEWAVQAQIVAALRVKGWTVWELFKGTARGGQAWCTKGLPDLYVFRPGFACWLEVKDDLGSLAPAQRDRHAELNAAGLPVYVVRSIDEAFAALGVQRVG